MRNIRNLVEYLKDSVNELRNEGNSSEVDSVIDEITSIEGRLDDIETWNNEITEVIGKMEESSYLTDLTGDLKPYSELIGKELY